MEKRKVEMNVRMDVPVSEIVDYVHELTQNWAERSGYVVSGKEEKKNFSPKARAIADVIDDVMDQFDSDQKRALAVLFGILLDEEIPIKDLSVEFVEFERYIMVVPIANPNEHNYPIGTPCWIIRHDEALISSGEEGNHLPFQKAALRPANKEEIEEFFKQFPESAFGKIGIFMRK